MQVDRVFDALASRPRREILAYLSKNELTTTELAERFAMSAPGISRHLSVLESAGLVASRRQGQHVLYSLVPDNLVNTLTGFAFEVCPVAGPLKREARALARRRKAGRKRLIPKGVEVKFKRHTRQHTAKGTRVEQVRPTY